MKTLTGIILLQKCARTDFEGHNGAVATCLGTTKMINLTFLLHKKYQIVQFLKINICSKGTTFALEKEHLTPKREKHDKDKRLLRARNGWRIGYRTNYGTHGA